MMLIEKRGEDEYDIQECGDFSLYPCCLIVMVYCEIH